LQFLLRGKQVFRPTFLEKIRGEECVTTPRSVFSWFVNDGRKIFFYPRKKKVFRPNLRWSKAVRKLRVSKGQGKPRGGKKEKKTKWLLFSELRIKGSFPTKKKKATKTRRRMKTIWKNLDGHEQYFWRLATKSF